MQTEGNKLSLSKNNFVEESQLKQNNQNKLNDISLDIKNIEDNSGGENDSYSQICIRRKYLFFNIKTIGKLIILSENEQGIIYVIGPLFPFYFILNLIANIFIIKVVFNNIPKIFQMIGNLLNVTQIYFFVFSSIKNPGFPLKEYSTLIYEEENKNAKNFRQCKDCKLWINTDEKTIHCRKCKICIEGYDHHCDCINICIGKNNLKSFYLMILFSFILIIYSILMTLSFK